MEVQLYSAACM